MFCKHTGCAETTVTAPQFSPLSEKMREAPCSAATQISISHLEITISYLQNPQNAA